MKNALSILIVLLILSMPLLAHADQTDASFDAWLEKYGAWDLVEQEISAETATDSPTSVLKRARVYLNLNSPEKALELIEMTSAFADNATEAQRLFLGGQAQRALGDLPKSVLWFTQSSKFFQNSAEMQGQFRAEPRLETIWTDVWTQSYWSYLANYTLSKSSQLEALNQILSVGRIVWEDDFWKKADMLINSANTTSLAVPESAQAKTGPDGQPLPPFVTVSDTEAIIRAMAMVSLEKFTDAVSEITTISNEPVRTFWLMVVTFLETGKQPQDLSIFESGNYMKPHAFWSGNILAPYSTSRAQWVLGNPESTPWKKFRNNLLSMPLDEARKAIDNELGSMLISEQTATLLNSFKLALALSNGDFAGSTTTWNKTNKKGMPLALQIAAALLFKEDLKEILPTEPAAAFQVYPILCALSGAAGRDLNPSTEAPFWTEVSGSNLQRLSSRDWPLDKLLLLAYWQQQFSQKPLESLAKRGAFLFENTAFGTQCLLYLADTAVQAKDLQLGAYYLNRISPESLAPGEKMAWLNTKIRLELDAGRDKAALDTFKAMAKLGEPVPVMTRLRMALLFQQQREYEAARDQLLAMWKDRDAMTTTLQAETMFWLGEGEQAMRNTEKALDYYLRLAWQYPQENIWALTAMYRASIIYEKRGKYETARNLLLTVIKRADTTEQREAAKARIDAIDRKAGTAVDGSKGGLVFPF
ncbi:MAG: tetratricopeptide repeat protein [Pseudodesulfovibrio sp.]